ncbi:MAG: class I SAM-dependent methyltransferase [Clostridia bacterium]|nr:class I SAM-dependent methyltransferase [Clostridia bacterium]
MDKHEIISFFDSLAPFWDEDMIRNEEVISEILDKGGICEGIHVLDVACGTGVLFPDYFSRNVASVTGIDISPEMVKIARSKFPAARVICDDACTASFERQFDVVMIYNAFPHFSQPEKLIEALAAKLCRGGRFSVAHGMSREEFLSHHAGRASKVSLPLPQAEELAEKLSPWFDVDVVISDEKMYLVSGTKKLADD